MTESIQRKKALCDQKRWKISKNGQVISLGEIAGKMMHWVDKFKEIGDAVAQLDPIHAALPWAAFRFLIEVNPTLTLSSEKHANSFLGRYSRPQDARGYLRGTRKLNALSS